MPTEPLPEEQRSAVETFVADWVSEERVPGAAVAVVDADETVYAEGFGARDLESNEPATPETLFGVGSCTKALTATAIMQLVDDGDLALDDSVEEYVPHLSDAPGDPITVEALLTHTSGLPSDGMAGSVAPRAFGQGAVGAPLSSESDFRRHVEGSLDRRVVGDDTFRYYNSGYTLLGRVLEAVTDQSFATYVERNVLDPLGMDRSTFDREGFEAADDRMTPYLEDDDGVTEAGFPFDSLIHPAGGLVCSVEALADYLHLFLDGGDERVLPPERIEAMTTPAGTFGTYLDGTEVGYGYGLMVEEYLDDRLVNHGGSIGVSSAWFGYLDDAQLGVTIACTTTPEKHPSDAGMGVLALLRDEDPRTVQPQYRLHAALDDATGEYEDYRDAGTATVERVGGGLEFEYVPEAGGGQTLLLTPTSVEQDSLVCTASLGSGMTSEVRFEFESDGNGADLFFDRLRLTKST